MNQKTLSKRTRSISVPALLAVGLAAAITGAAINNQVAGGLPLDLEDARVNTLRAKRIEIMDDEWRIRMVLSLKDDRPVIAVFDEDGEPVKLVTIDLR
jgi:UDP-N-acetyl-D-mannosaminuronate dehydrogenase